jgi:hypothetical protein
MVKRYPQYQITHLIVGDPILHITETANEIYGTCLAETAKLLKAGARVCKVGSLMFLLLGPKNYHISPQGVKGIGWIGITVVPNNELRTLNIYYKYADA